MMCGGVTAICSSINANRARSHLADCHNVCELSRTQPLMFHYGFHLYQRQHSVAPTEAKEPNLKESKEEREKNHVLKAFRVRQYLLMVYAFLLANLP